MSIFGKKKITIYYDMENEKYEHVVIFMNTSLEKGMREFKKTFINSKIYKIVIS